MKKSNRRQIISMLLVAFACVTTIVGVFLLMQKPRSKAVVTDGQTMFAADGSYSSSLVSQLSALVANVEKTAVGTTQRSNAAQIRMANGGAVPQVKLFETIGVTSSTKQSFTEQQWRLVYITHPSGNGTPVFTFFMSDPYRNSIFDVAPTHYNSSVIRANLTNDIADILNYFPGVSRNIVTPANLPGAWQSNQPDNAFHENNSITGDALNDKIWLPSTYELDIDSTFWSLSFAERFSSQNSFSDEAWLRSSNGGNANYGVAATNGSANAWYPELAENHAVRPAIHISFQEFVTNNDPLFKSGGPHNIALAEQLRTLADVAVKDNAGNVGIGYYRTSNAEQIRIANGGALPEIQLFENARQHFNNFTEKLWRLVYISHVDGAPVFTFMMTGAYAETEFGYSFDNTYENSIVRANLTGDFDTVLGFFSDVSDYIVAPRNLPGTQFEDMGAADNDLIWLPSVEELVNPGYWNLTQAERGYLTNGFSPNAWTRTSAGSGSVHTITTDGGNITEDTWSVNAIRPAIHITLPITCPTCNGQPCVCPNDVVAVRAFLLQKQAGVTNAQKLGIDAYDPSTWGNYFKFNGSNRLTRIGTLNQMLISNLSRDLHGKIEFPGCTALESILLSGNRFTGIDVSTNISLLNLEIEDNLLTTLDVSNNPALISLIVANNENLTTLNVSNNPALLFLNALHTNLSGLDVTNCPSLTMLIATGTFSSLDTTNNPSLSILFALSENLYSIFTASNPMLEVLVVSGVFPVLDVSGNTLLTTLFVSSPYLTSLDVTNNIYLTDLAVNNTGIYDLNLEYNRSLTYLNVSNNNLGSLDFFNNADLSYVNISNNNINNVIMPNHGYMQTFEAHGNPLNANFINSITEHVEDSLYAIEYFSYSYGDSLFAAINKNGFNMNVEVMIDIMPYYFFVDISNPGPPTQYITITLGDEESVLRQATNRIAYQEDLLNINTVDSFEEMVALLEEDFAFGLWTHTSTPLIYKAKFNVMPISNDASLIVSFTCDDPCTDTDCPIHSTLDIWNPQLTHSVTNGVYYSHVFAAAAGATEYALVSGTVPTGLAFSSSLRTLTGIPYVAPGLYTFTIRATVGGVNIDRVITINVAPATLANQYIITESGSIFTAVALDDMGVDYFVGAENSIQDLIYVIRDDANGNDCSIAFRAEYLAPDYYAPLDIGMQSITFDGAWGTVTIGGGITSSIGSSGQAAVMIDGVNVTSNANIFNTAVSGSCIAVMLVHDGNFTMTGGMISADSAYGVAIYHNSSGSLIINGGTVTAVGGHGIAIQNESNGFITIEETSGAIYIVGTAEDRMGTIHLNLGNGICDIISGTIINTSSGTALVTHGPTIYIIGGVIRGGTYTVGIEDYGIVNMSGGTVENENSGAFYISSLLGVTLYISGGQITANTAIFCEPSGRYDQILLSGNPIMNGRIETKASKLAIIPVFNTANRVYDLKILSGSIGDSMIAVSGGTGYLSSFNLVQTPGYTLKDDGTNLVLYINESQLAPEAPALSLNAIGDTVTITPLIGGEFQWRYAGETAWNDLGTANTFTVTTGITAGRTYEARVRIAAIGGDPASDWSPIGSLVHPTFTITYNRNGGNGTIASQTKYHGTGNPITLSAGTGFSRTGWYVSSWNTAVDGKGTSYPISSTYTANASQTLYAVWTRIPIDWSYPNNNVYAVTNGVAMTSVVFPVATGGNGSFSYYLIGNLPNGITFDAATRTISGTPNAAPGRYDSIAYAESLYDGGGVLVSRSVRIDVSLGTQTAPSAPGISINAAGDTVTIGAVSGGEYQWRYVGETAWNDLGTANTFNISTGITAGRGYEARRRLAATVTHNASNWSITTSYAHPTYTITYNNNGGTGTIQNQIKFHGTLNPVNLNAGGSFSRVGWDLTGWNTAANGLGTSYALNFVFSANAGLSLFAVWEKTPIAWSLVNTEYHVTIGVAITPIVLPAATGGNDIFIYSVDYLPTGLTFDPATRTISGTPYDAADTYQAIATAQSAYDGDIVSMYRTLTFVVTLNTQVVPTAPTLSLNAAGDVVTISAVSGGEYQWRYAGAGVWTALGTNNTFTVTTGITADRGYEARRRLAATETHAASDWSSIGSLAHPTYTITYNNNGGTGTIASQTKYHGTFNTITFNDGANFSRPGWELIAWNTAANGMGTQYILTAVVGTNANFDLFAVWERIPITWEISSTEYYVTNGITITDIVLPVATGGNGIITYTATSLPDGLVFDTGTRTISGTPNAAPGKYFVIVSAKSTYDGGTVSSGDIAIEFNVAAGTQTAPAAPSLSFWNPAGNTITISPVGGGSGYEYRWRYEGEITWNVVSNIFTVTTGITAGRTYQAQVRYAATTTHDASPWSASGTMVHSEYYIRYYSNGGTGTIANQTKYYGTLNPVTLDNGENFSRAGWNLTGWNTAPDESGLPHDLSEQYTANAPLFLYAVWERTPVDWSLDELTYNVTNGVAISSIYFLAATGGDGSFDYTVTGLPAGLTFDSRFLTITGVPNEIPGRYYVTATATSTYDGDSVSAVITLVFFVNSGTQDAPSAPTLGISATGVSILIAPLIAGGYEYQWRSSTADPWISLGTNSTFTIPTGLTGVAAPRYEVQIRFAATFTHDASPWSVSRTLIHPTYTITYNNNGGTGSISNQTKFHGTLNPVNLSDGANFSRPGWHITGWNTASHGLGDPYALNSSYTANAELNLFAIWSQNSLDWNPQLTHFVTNGVSYSHTFAAADEQFGATDFVYSRISGTVPNGLTFNAATRVLSGIPNTAPGEYTFTIRASMYGINLDRVITITVAAGTQNQPTAPTLNLNLQGYEVTISAISGGEYRWRYAGEIAWNELGTTNTFVVPSGGLAIGGTYEAQRRLAATSTHTASQWSPTGSLAHPEYTITYNNNGGEGTIANQTKYHGSMNIVILNNGGNFSRNGWNLIGWNTAVNGLGQSYALGYAYSADAGFTLYAVWERIPITWSLQDSLNNVTNGTAITDIIFPVATGGNDSIMYTVTGLPNGLSFNAETRTISGTPNVTAGTYDAIATATSTYNGGSVSAFRTITFAVSLGNQGTPTAPTLTLNATGGTVTIATIAGGEYQWRYAGEIAWNSLGTANTFSVTTGITVSRTYEARRRLAPTETQSASEWSPVGSLAHPESIISYHNNDGVGTISAQTKYFGSLNPITLSDGTGFSRPGWTLIEWRSEADGTGSAFPLGSVYTGNIGWTLYAVWERIPITWMLEDASHNVTNGTAISDITFPLATGGNGTIIYTVTGLPSGLTFNAATRTISGTPDTVPGAHHAIATVMSTYDGGSVSAVRTITFVVALGTQTAPSAPSLTLNAAGDTVTIGTVNGGEYRWRYVGEITWNELGANNTFNVTTGITSGRTYEAQRRLAATETFAASNWSSATQLVHITFGITYNNNGGSGTISNQTKFHGTLNPVTLSDGFGFSRPGWTLTGWNTNATSTGTPYTLGMGYTGNAALTLFAVWSPNSVTWNPQVAHSTLYNSFYTHTFAVATEELGATDFVYSFVSGTLPNGMTFNASTRVLSGTPNDALGDYIFTIRASINGIDVDRVITVTVNAATQVAPTAPTLALNEIGNIVTISTVAGAEYRWRYSGETTWLELGTDNIFIVTSDLTSGRTYEAQRRLVATSTHEASPWSATGSLAHPTYTITYNNNEGAGTIANQTKYHGTSNSVNLNGGGNFTRGGWTLIGWNNAANGTGTPYGLGAQYNANAGLTLFAIWERKQIAWSLVDTTYEVTRNIAITDIVLPAATGGNDTIVYTVTGLPTGLTFNAATRTISGTPNAAAGAYSATATAASTYDGDTVSAIRTLIFNISLASQPTPSAPTLEINTAGDIVTITTIAGGEYQWRIAGSSTWTSLGAANTFNIPTGVTSATVYEAQRRWAATGSLAESPWSSVGSTTHQTYIISYNLNGGTGSILNQTKFHGILNPVILRDNANFTRPGWTLTGWNTNAAGTGTAYAINAQYTSNAGISLFAVWTQNPMQWNPVLSLPDGFGGYPYTRALAPLASGIDQTFTYTLYSGSLGGLVLSTSGVITGTLNTVTGTALLQFVVAATSNNGQSIVSGTFTLTVNTGAPTCPNPCTDPDCPIHGSIKPTLPGAKLEKDEDRITLAGIANPEIYTYSWSFKVGSGSFEMISAGTTQTYVVFVQDEKYKTTYRCQIYFGDDLIKTLEYVIYPPKGPSIFNNPIVTAGLLFIGVIIFVLFLIMLWMQRDRRRNSHVIIGEDNGKHGSGKSGLVGHCDNKPIIPGTGLVGCDKKTRKRRTGLIKD